MPADQEEQGSENLEQSQYEEEHQDQEQQQEQQSQDHEQQQEEQSQDQDQQEEEEQQKEEQQEEKYEEEQQEEEQQEEINQQQYQKDSARKSVKNEESAQKSQRSNKNDLSQITQNQKLELSQDYSNSDNYLQKVLQQQVQNYKKLLESTHFILDNPSEGEKKFIKQMLVQLKNQIAIAGQKEQNSNQNTDRKTGKKSKNVEAMMKEIFTFYAKMNVKIDKQTFEDQKKQYDIMKLSEFTTFCRFFEIEKYNPLFHENTTRASVNLLFQNSKLVAIFTKEAYLRKQCDFEQFKTILIKIATYGYNSDLKIELEQNNDQDEVQQKMIQDFYNYLGLNSKQEYKSRLKLNETHFIPTLQTKSQKIELDQLEQLSKMQRKTKLKPIDNKLLENLQQKNNDKMQQMIQNLEDQKKVENFNSQFNKLKQQQVNDGSSIIFIQGYQDVSSRPTRKQPLNWNKVESLQYNDLHGMLRKDDFNPGDLIQGKFDEQDMAFLMPNQVSNRDLGRNRQHRSMNISDKYKNRANQLTALTKTKEQKTIQNMINKQERQQQQGLKVIQRYN